eukprot:jgi/Galph1/3801/GphlegSOOS_G2476.1
MVSFCCDKCQEVIKKPKVENHFYFCKTPAVSCVDCGQTFNRQAASLHNICITEKEKYEKQQSKNNTAVRLEGDGDTFCRTCNIPFNSPLQAEQHYHSKRHASSVKRKLQNQKEQHPTNGLNSVPEEYSKQELKNNVNQSSICKHEEPNGLTQPSVGKKESSSTTERKLSLTNDQSSSKVKSRGSHHPDKKRSLKKTITKIVSHSRKGVRLSALLNKLKEKGFSSTKLEKRVEKRIKSSHSLVMHRNKIKLKS